MFRALDTEAVYITKRIQHTTLAIVFAICVVFGLMPFAGAAENTNSADIGLEQNNVLNTNNNAITNDVVDKLSQDEVANLQSWLKSKNITATINDGNLTIGATGENVKSLQKWLKENNFYNGEIDGNFGTDTEAAVKAFQKEVGLLDDGKVGYYTLLAMQEWDEYAETVTNTVSASSDEEETDYSSKSTSSTKKKTKKTYSTKTYKKSYTSSRYRGYTNGMDCWAMSSYLSSKLRSQGYTTRTIQYATSMSSRHRSVQYYSNGGWVNYDYAGNGYSQVYYATKSSGSVVG